MSREQRATAEELLASFIRSRLDASACSSVSDRAQLVRLVVDMMQQLYTGSGSGSRCGLASVSARRPGLIGLAHAAASGRDSLASSEDVSDAEAAEIGILYLQPIKH